MVLPYYCIDGSLFYRNGNDGIITKLTTFTLILIFVILCSAKWTGVFSLGWKLNMPLSVLSHAVKLVTFVLYLGLHIFFTCPLL